MNLIERAKQTFRDNTAPGFSEELSITTKLYNAGWYNGEWTCAKCGCMIGKNLKGESPFGLAYQHSAKCNIQ